MPTSLQFRRGNTLQNDNFTGSAGELSIDTQLHVTRLHDGTTVGGFPLVGLDSTQTLTNKTLTSPVINGLSDPVDAQEPATKAYVDSGLSSLSSTTLTEGNSSVVVADSGTGNVTITIDGSTHSTLAAAGITLSQGAFVGNLTGNASTATQLATTRAIQVSGAVTGTANFDGSAGINIVTTNTADPTITLAGDLTGSVTLTNLASGTLTATIAANSVALGTDTTGNFVGAGATSGNGISGSVASEGGTFTITSNATNTNSANTIVFRDASGNFSAGTVTATATSAQYADLAERYTSDSNYEPGTVVVFGGDKEVTASTDRLSKRIAGIISTDPAYLMNSALTNGVTVGLLGRVPCKVVGEVRKGDLMVSSSIVGHAVAWRDESNPPMGSVIGKALENKSGASTGVIEVVVGKI